MIDSSSKDSQSRRGFTLLELLIVITIMFLLMSITIYSVNLVRESDRVEGAASRVRSYLSGARDRAIYEGSPVGVRFFLDSETDPNALQAEKRTVTSMIYIDPEQNWTDGTIRLERPDLDGDGIVDSNTVTVVAGVGTGWWELKRRGLLIDGVSIQIGDFISPVSTALLDVTSSAGPPAVQRLVMAIPYADAGSTSANQIEAFDAGGPSTYNLTLPAAILPVEPVIFPNDVVLDLDGSRLPPAWRPSAANGLAFSQYMDIVFSPRGNVIGEAAAQGIIHLYICDKEDATSLKREYINTFRNLSENEPAQTINALTAFELQVQGTPPLYFVPSDEIDPDNTSWISGLADSGDPYLPKDRRIVTISTQTGDLNVNSILPNDSDNDGFADAPFFFSESGQGAR